jgi:predicted unusual protein kinase regulating ubiquinone biosynthesis (AarF/ABC1/UbiB family)
VGVSTTFRIQRARRISTAFGRIYLGIRTNRFIERRIAPPDMARRWSRFHRDSASHIHDAAIELRGLILKGCQFLGSRADVLPPEYVATLSRLQDRVPPHGFATVRRTVERELGRGLFDVFSEFEREPIASASLAQVHRAITRDGREVAVKVQYPEIAALVRGDLANLRFLFRAVGLLERDFDLMPLVDELSETVPCELDFVNEGRNAERIGGFFAGRDDLCVPRIHWDVSSERVLVMDRMDGIKVSDVAALRGAGIDPSSVMRILVEAYCEQVLVHGFFHADPHPGNLLVQPRPQGPRVVFLDFGLAKQLPEGFRRGVLGLVVALIRGDTGAMAQALLALGFETRDGSVASLAGLAGFVLEAAQQVRAQAHLDAELAKRLREEIPERVRQNPLVRIPSHLVLVGRVLGLLSGLARTLESRLDLLRAVLPYALPAGPEPGRERRPAGGGRRGGTARSASART